MKNTGRASGTEGSGASGAGRLLTRSGHSTALHLELHDPLADRLAIEELAVWCARFSPTVGLEEGEPQESLLLDVSGIGALFGGERALAEHIVQAFAERGLTARVAIADTVGAAWAVAHFARLEKPEASADQARECRELATILRRVRQPIIVPAGENERAIDPLPVEALRLPEQTCGLLADLGLRRIEQVAALPRSTLLARFGPLVLGRLDAAWGQAAEAIAARPARVELEFAWPLEHATDRREMIEFALFELVARACEALARERRGLLRLECRFEYENAPCSSFVVGLYRPSAAVKHVGELVRLKLESFRFRAPVAGIAVAVLAADRLEFRQQELQFRQPEMCVGEQPQRQESPRELAALVDRLSNRLGPHAVARAWLMASAQPEFVCQYQPMASLKTRRARKSARGPNAAIAKAPSVKPPGDRPLYLEREPVRTDVMSIAPEGAPIQFSLANRQERVVRAWGPERIETGWWRTRLVRRDYYQVETASGARLWLFRQLNTGGWFLHGEFA